MSIFSDMVLEVMFSSFEAHKSDEDDDWRCSGIMESEKIWRDGTFEHQKSVVLDSNLNRKKRFAGIKPTVVGETDDYSWRTEKLVEIEEGDYIMVGEVQNDNRMQEIITSVILYRIEEIEKDAFPLKGEIKLEKIKCWTKEGPCLTENFLRIIDPEYRKAAKKALKFKHYLTRDYWFMGSNKYDYVGGL